MTDSPPGPPASSEPRRDRLFLPAILVTGLAIRVYLLLATHRTAEDFYITLRYAENIAHGRGFVYNAGQHVLGTTTPLYTLYLAVMEWLGLNTILLGQLLNIAADTAACYALARLARAALGAKAYPCGLAAAAVMAVWPPSIYWSISGMETGLVTLCGLCALGSAAERRTFSLAAWAALLVLLRIDGLLLAAICFGWLALNARKRPADSAEEMRREEEGSPVTSKSLFRAVCLFAALLLPWAVFAAWYFGSPVPTSLIAKLHVYGWQNPGLFPNLVPFARDMTRNPLYLALLAGALPGIWLTWRHEAARPALAWMLAYYAGMALSKSFLFGWYYVPPAPVYVLASVVGWAGVGRWVVGSLGRGVRCSGVQVLRCWGWGRWVVAGILMGGIALAPRQRALIAADQREDEALLKATGVMLRGVVRPGETLMLEPIGWIGYYSEARVLDAVGLVSPEVIPFFRPGAVSPYLDILADLKPEWVLLRTGEYDAAVAAPVPPERHLLAGYALYREISNPSNPGGRPAFYLLRRR